MWFDNILPEWDKALTEWNLKKLLGDILNKAYENNATLPDKEDVLRLFSLIKPQDIKVIIIGQDPYHTPGVADGIAFSTRNKKIPPSLKNIFKELKNDLQIERTNPDLTDWVKQGIFLINPVFTVLPGQPNSHAHLGYRDVVCQILSHLNEANPHLIYCLWGNVAKSLYNNLSYKVDMVVKSVHPSPLSYARGFANSKPFSKINEFLKKADIKAKIDW